MNNNMLPLGWKKCLLDSVTKRGSGHTPSKNFPEYWNGGVKWVSLSDSSALDKGYVFKTEKEISKLGIQNSSAVVHPKETVVMSRDAGVGKSAVLAEDMAVSQHFIAWQCDNENKMNSWFLYYWLQSMKAEFERQAIGSTIKTIGLPYFKKLQLPVPPYAEQQKIAKILLAWDKAISVTGQLISNCQTQKRALMQGLLTGIFRLPMFSGDWESVRLINIGNTYSGLSGKTKDDFGVGDFFVPYINVYKNSRVDINSLEKVFISPFERQHKVVYGDILFTVSSETPDEVGMSSVVLEHKDDLYLNSFCFGLRLNDFNVLLPEYARYLFRSEHVRKEIIKLAQGATRYNLSKKRFMDIEIPLPSVSEQKKIAEVLTAADREIEIYQQKLLALKQEKQALMQQLLTGKRRVAL